MEEKTLHLLKRLFQWKRMYLLLGFPLGAVLILLAKLDQTWVEQIYAQKVHAFFENTLGRLVSMLPFSVSEWLIAAAVLGVVAYIVWVILRLCRQPGRWKHILYRTFVNFLCTGSIAYFLFVITMGLCYYRTPASQYLSLSVKQYSVEELAEVTMWLSEQANLEREKLEEDEQGVAKLQEETWWDTSAEAQACFNKISETYPGIGTVTARNKPMVFSKIMSSVLTMGVYIPYTFESSINVDMTAYTVPATMCHELSHVKGFMREDEANFLGFLACMQSKRADFRYSGYMSAFGYALNRLASEDYDAAVKVANNVSDAVARDDSADHAYWEQYRGTVVADTSGEIYNAYLESNDQQDGVKSYGRMLDLVIAWYQSEVRGQ